MSNKRAPPYHQYLCNTTKSQKASTNLMLTIIHASKQTWGIMAALMISKMIFYLKWVKAGDDSAVLHMAAPGWVGKLALSIRPRAGTSLKLTTHFQSQPFGVPSHGHADSHQRCSRSQNSGGSRWTENCLMNNKIFFSLAQRGSESFWLMYFGGGGVY